MKRMIFLACMLAVFAGAQGTQTSYTVNQQTDLSGTAEVITIQQPNAGARNVTFKSAYFDCSVPCGVQVERNGTAATTTATTINAVNPGAPAPRAQAFRSSNVGNGTVLSTMNCPGACAIGLDLSGIAFTAQAGNKSNLTIRTTAITGRVDISVKFEETIIQ